MTPGTVRGRRELSIALQSDENLATYASLAPQIEELGFGTISIYSDLLYPSPLLPLITIAQATGSIRLGPACLNPYLLHPLEIANQLHILDTVSNGRAYLGLARGAWLDAVGVAQERPVRRLREAVAVLRHLFAGNDDAYRGEVFQVEQGTCLAYRPVRAEVDLMLGTWGPLGMSLAGELASEVKIGGTANPALLAPAKKSLARGEARAQRPPGETGLVCGAVTVVDDDGAFARRLARAEVAMYLPVVAALDPAPGLEEVDLAAMQSLTRAGLPRRSRPARTGLRPGPVRLLRDTGAGSHAGSRSFGGRCHPRRVRDAARPHGSARHRAPRPARYARGPCLNDAI